MTGVLSAANEQAVQEFIDERIGCVQQQESCIQVPCLDHAASMCAMNSMQIS